SLPLVEVASGRRMDPSIRPGRGADVAGGLHAGAGGGPRAGSWHRTADPEKGTCMAPDPSRSTQPLQPIRDGQGASILGPTNPAREAESPDVLVPPRTDAGSMPNLRWSFADSHMRLEEGGWARQATARELPVATEIAFVNMRLEAGAVRELHFHKEAEWAYMI